MTGLQNVALWVAWIAGSPFVAFLIAGYICEAGVLDVVADYWRYAKRHPVQTTVGAALGLGAAVFVITSFARFAVDL